MTITTIIKVRDFSIPPGHLSCLAEEYYGKELAILVDGGIEFGFEGIEGTKNRDAFVETLTGGFMTFEARARIIAEKKAAEAAEKLADPPIEPLPKPVRKRKKKEDK